MRNLLFILCCCSITSWITAITASIGLFYGGYQLINFSRTKTADFIHRFKIDFFNDRSRAFLFFIDMDLIKFREPENKNDYAYFFIKKNRIKCLPKRYKYFKDHALAIILNLS